MRIRRSSDAVAKKIAEQRAQMCMLGLGEMQEPWPCGGWILSVFVRVLEKVQTRGKTKLPTSQPQREHAASTANCSNQNTANYVMPHQTGQDVTMGEPPHSGELQVGSNGVGFDSPMVIGQFSMDDSAFMLDMLNEPDFSFPDLGRDLTSQVSQVPYFRDFSMLGL
jgi:hypothetical protein